MNYPKITIVTPVFNQEKYLEETICSVLEQNYPNLEYIIIDGGSTDGTLDIIKKYADKLAYWVSEPDKGMYDAIQKGFDKSTGEIMAWIGSDDMYHRKSLFTVAELFSSLADVNWIEGVSTMYDNNGRTLYVNQSRVFCKYDFYMSDFFWIQQESCFWRRSLWDKAGSCMNINLKYAGDFDLWLRFFRYDKLYVADVLIGGYRCRGKGQLSHDHLSDYMDEVKQQISKKLLSERDKDIIKKYIRTRSIYNVLKRFKYLDSYRLIKRFKRKNFCITPLIKYNFDSSSFYFDKNIRY